ncbi:MAG: PAS domain S-box protein [Deltaproteobacteria bacterium]|nr:PAS domain S-box protein [Deltaproteobacteria bacterium]MBW2051945.1 PAS domain S-box protein [Deltaproteobacteria bacterium]MBW2139900.1 PAS domain S-box protein [Deltaproteobacteria bacterium]MBW2323081.1 PAS domain S-box protein [Deltaproteobacteria bacterium]
MKNLKRHTGNPPKSSFAEEKSGEDAQSHEGSWLVSLVDGKQPSAPSGKKYNQEENTHDHIDQWGDREIPPEDEPKAGMHYKRTIASSYTFQHSGNDFILIGCSKADEIEASIISEKFIGGKASEVLNNHPGVMDDIRECYQKRIIIKRCIRAQTSPGDEDRTSTLIYSFVPPDMVQVIEQDVTELALMHEVLREHEKKYRSIFESTLAGIYRTRIEDGKYLMANQALADMLGYDSVRQLISETTSLERYLHSEKRNELIRQASRKDRLDNFELVAVKRDGTQIPILLSANIYPERGYLEGVAVNIEKRKRAEEVLKDSRLRLQELSAQLLSAQERERKHIASELHDSIGQSLTAIKYGVESVLEEIDEEPSVSIKPALSAVLAMIQQVMNEIRKLQANLRPPILDDLGLLPTISWFCREFQTIYSRLRVIWHLELKENDIPEPIKIVIFRIVQEAMNNVAKHSESETIHLFLRKTQTDIELTIEDDGQGFNPNFTPAAKGLSGGFGLDTMRERAGLSGGRLEIESKKGKGTTIRAFWPICS